MGNSQPTNRTGRKVTAQKLEHAKKLGVLSLSEHSLKEIPAEVFQTELAGKLRTLDLSKNSISRLGPIGKVVDLKSLNLESNRLPSGSLGEVAKMGKLQSLNVSSNLLGRVTEHHQAESQDNVLPNLPVSLKRVNLSSNYLSHVPRQLLAGLSKLENLDLSSNQLATVPEEISSLSNLQELILDSNVIVSLPQEVGSLRKLKVLSLRNNRISIHCSTFSEQDPQPLPKPLFSDTSLIDLNLHGCPMTNTQLNAFDGFQDFLDRRQKVKMKTLTNLEVCGLD